VAEVIQRVCPCAQQRLEDSASQQDQVGFEAVLDPDRDPPVVAVFAVASTTGAVSAAATAAKVVASGINPTAIRPVLLLTVLLPDPVVQGEMVLAVEAGMTTATDHATTDLVEVAATASLLARDMVDTETETGTEIGTERETETGIGKVGMAETTTGSDLTTAINMTTGQNGDGKRIPLHLLSVGVRNFCGSKSSSMSG
jgi:hypothetical protein